MIKYKQLNDFLNVLDEEQLDREIALYEEDINLVSKVKRLDITKKGHTSKLKDGTPILIVEVPDLLALESEEEEDIDI